jgi:predicted Zn finger-like uncharacterized protein
MDVRCEKCLTVYDFDEAQVGPGGVTVKCTQCGNLFKVRRRDTAEMPIARTPDPPARERKNTLGRLGTNEAGSTPPPAKEPSQPKAFPREGSASQWMVRLADDGEIFRFREMTTLSQWIVEHKVTRDDEISRDGATWKPLGGIPELEPFFRTAEQARAAEGGAPGLPVADWGADVPLALSTTAPQTSPLPMRERSAPRAVVRASIPTGNSGPSVMGRVPADADNDPAFAETSPKTRLPPVVDELAAMDVPPEPDDLPPRKSRWPFVVIPLLLALGGGGAWFFLSKGGSKETRAQKLMAQAHTRLLVDTDDAFRQAAELYSQAHGAEETAALPLAGLAQAKTTWAFYLREDARTADAAVAATLRREAQAHLDDARRSANEALQLAPDAPEVNRAMADFLRVDGAPAAEVDRYLRRASEKLATDAETAYVAGALLYRDGKNEEARRKLEQANTLAQASFHQPLLPASYLLARIAVAANSRDDAKTALQGILAASPGHDRARAMLSSLEGPKVDAGAAKAPTTPPATPVQPTPTTPPVATAKTPSAPTGDETPKSGGGDYGKLISQAERLLENGRTDQAKKLYEKALTVDPQGIDAVVGLGYCDLDREKFLAAVDHFKRALQIAPEHGEALIGLAEAYKIRGDRTQAIDYYQRYLRAQPGGAKASMAQKNIKELEAKGPPKAPAPSLPEPPKADTPKPEAPPAPKPEPEKAVEKPAEKPEKKEEKPAGDTPPAP